MEEQTLDRLRKMLKVEIDRVEDRCEELVVYVPKDRVAKAIGSGGCVARAAELVIKRKLTIKESTG